MCPVATYCSLHLQQDFSSFSLKICLQIKYKFDPLKVQLLFRVYIFFLKVDLDRLFRIWLGQKVPDPQHWPRHISGRGSHNIGWWFLWFSPPFTASFWPPLTDTGWEEVGRGGGLSWDELDDGDTFPMAERKPPERWEGIRSNAAPVVITGPDLS